MDSSNKSLSSKDDVEIKRRVTLKEATEFINSVKTVLGAKSVGFINMFKDYSENRIDTKQVITLARYFLKDHRELKAGFNLFLPKGYDISDPFEDEAFEREMEPHLEDAHKFIKNVKERLNGEDYAYFLKLLCEHQNTKNNVENLCSEIGILFSGEPDLFREFNSFLPAWKASDQY